MREMTYQDKASYDSTPPCGSMVCCSDSSNYTESQQHFYMCMQPYSGDSCHWETQSQQDSRTPQRTEVWCVVVTHPITPSLNNTPIFVWSRILEARSNVMCHLTFGLSSRHSRILLDLYGAIWIEFVTHQNTTISMYGAATIRYLCVELQQYDICMEPLGLSS